MPIFIKIMINFEHETKIFSELNNITGLLQAYVKTALHLKLITAHSKLE